MSPTTQCRRPVAIDLFAGVGGFSLGIEQAGFDVLAAVEADPIHAAAHQFNFPFTTIVCADITTLNGETIRTLALRNQVDSWHNEDDIKVVRTGEIDLVVGGPPCQGFSAMGKRLNYDLRNELVFHFCRLVSELQPRYFVMENVPGMTVPRYDSLWEQLMQQFNQAGYAVLQPIQILNAAHVGVPQERQRLFVLGSRIGEPALDYPVFNQESVEVTVGDAIADLPNVDDFLILTDSDEVALNDAQLDRLTTSASLYVRQLRGLEPDPADLSYPRLWDPKQLTSSRRTLHTAESVGRFAQTPGGQLETKSRLRRLDLNQRAHTLRAGTGRDRGRFTAPRPIHPIHCRVISVREAARLHSFPDWFRFHVTKWHGFRQVGNAVPPLLGRAIGQQVCSFLGLSPSKPTTEIALGDPNLLKLNRFRATKHFSRE